MFSEPNTKETDINQASAPSIQQYFIDFTSLAHSIYPSLEPLRTEIPELSSTTDLKYTRKLCTIIDGSDTNQITKHGVLLLSLYLKEAPQLSTQSNSAEFLTEFYQFLKKYHPRLKSDTLKALFLFKNQSGYDLLKHIACTPGSLGSHVTALLDDLRLALGKEVIVSLLTSTQKNSWNLLQLASKHNGPFAVDLVAFILKHQEWLGVDTIKSILGTKNHYGMNALQVAIVHHPKTASFLLDFCMMQANTLGKDFLWNLFNEQDLRQWNAISLALFYQQDIAQQMIPLLKKPKTIFDNEKLTKMVYINPEACGLGHIELLILEHPLLLRDLMTLAEPGTLQNSDIRKALSHFLFDEIQKLDNTKEHELETIQWLATRQYQLCLSDDFFAYAREKPINVSIKEALFIAYETKLAQKITHESSLLHSVKYYLSGAYTPQIKLSVFNTLKRSTNRNEKLRELMELFPELQSGQLGEIYKLCLRDQSKETQRRMTK